MVVGIRVTGVSVVALCIVISVAVTLIGSGVVVIVIGALVVAFIVGAAFGGAPVVVSLAGVGV
eukprot:971897-Prorocentrum_lima.AAC.1